VGAWLTTIAANAAEDLRRGNIPGYRAKVGYRLVHLAPKPQQPQGADLFDRLPAPAHTCCDSHELLCRFLREGLGSPLTEQCLEHLRVCARCAGLLEHVALELISFVDNANSKMCHPSFVDSWTNWGCAIARGSSSAGYGVRPSPICKRFERPTNHLPPCAGQANGPAVFTAEAEAPITPTPPRLSSV
jgi:hypothetical protein